MPANIRSIRATLGTALVVAATAAAVLAPLAPASSADAATGATTTGAVHYVDCRSTAVGFGTMAQPWGSLPAVRAHGDFAPGDQILLRRGTTCLGHLLLQGSGTAANPITVGAYGRGAVPFVQGRGTAESTGAVQIADGSNWVVQDLRVSNTPKRSDHAHRSAVLVENRRSGRLSGIILRRLHIQNVKSHLWAGAGVIPQWSGGIALITTSIEPKAGFDHVRIMDNHVRDVGRSGIVTWNAQGQNQSSWDHDVRIAGNNVRRALGDGILMSGVIDGRIDHNLAADGSNLPKCPISTCPDSKSTASAGIWPIFSKNLRIDHNEAYGTGWGPGDGEGFDIDASTSSVVFEDNYSHDNEGGGLLLCGSKNVTVRFNIFENNAKSALAFIGTMPATGTKIYNNTIYSSSRSRARPVRYFNGPYRTDIAFENNIVFNYGYATWLWPAKPKTAANTLVGLHGSGRPTDKRTSRQQPALRAPGSGGDGRGTLSGYKPVKGSKASTGVAIPRAATTDFFGKRIDPKHPPRGAAG